MTIDHHHIGGGCDAIIHSEGNELIDAEVHYYYCENIPTNYVYMVSGTRLAACDEHTREWEKFSVHTEKIVAE